MKKYNPTDILNLANQIYNLKLSKNTKTENETIKKAIKRALQKKGISAPYEVTQEQAYYLINTEMNSYFLKKSEEKNPSFKLDKQAYSQMKQKQQPETLTYQQALVNVKLDMIISLLGKMQQANIKFDNDNFKKAFNEFRQHTDVQGFPMPGYTESKRFLNDPYNFFKVNSETK